MTLDGIARVLDSTARLLGVLVWPVVTVYVSRRFASPLRDLIDNLTEFSLKGGGFEASGKRKSEAAASLAVASASKNDVPDSPDATTENVRATAKLVSEIATPRVIRRAKQSTVLWVDDRPSNNVNERIALQAMGVRFVLATSTDEALTQSKMKRLDFIISDMNRPGDPQAGYTLLDALRNEGDSTPYLIYAGSRSDEDNAEARRRGALGCTNRPNDLFEMVLSSLGRGVQCSFR